MQLNTIYEDTKKSLGEEKFILPLKFSICQTWIPNEGIFPIVTTAGVE
jgi:hypothetical protein